VDTDSSVRCGKVALLSEILQTLLSEIDGTEDLRILRFEPVYDPMQARAHLVVNV
jgi:hypothetical protein